MGSSLVLQTCSRPMNRSVSEGVAQVAKPAVSPVSKPACRGLSRRVDRYFPIAHGELLALPSCIFPTPRFMESSPVLQTCSRPMNRSVSEGVAQVAKPAVSPVAKPACRRAPEGRPIVARGFLFRFPSPLPSTGRGSRVRGGYTQRGPVTRGAQVFGFDLP